MGSNLLLRKINLHFCKDKTNSDVYINILKIYFKDQIVSTGSLHHHSPYLNPIENVWE